MYDGRHGRSSLGLFEVPPRCVALGAVDDTKLYRLQNVNPGFSYARLASFTVSLPQRKYVTEEQRTAFFKRLLDNISGLPGVEASAVASGLPLGNNGWQTSFLVDGQPKPPRDQTPLMEACTLHPITLGREKSLVRGRSFDQDIDLFGRT